ncbi:tripartite tricarboxylate transporter substrate binding protein [Variovorax sp. KK3]|uniref:Bug family tripartite tricarboxylate transporter substrate binding protein n=1 Tax=Variovorax sp. KK3 TaxID=1855728 RepID=UPI0015C31359|nr:tripartite tricarboxylate transporter substrate binding protein [Variovorax sp. KK3]
MSLLKLASRPPFTWAIAGVLLAAGAGTAIAADDYPNRPVTIVNPWAAGGPSDAIIRPVAQQLGARLGQSFVIDNKSGANGTIGATFVARAKPDGYTLFYSHLNPIAIAPSLPPKPPYDPVKDFMPISLIASGPAVLVVRGDFPAKTLAELTAYAKANPGKVSYGSVGIGSNTHLAGSMLAQAANVDMIHVPYRGSAAIQTDILGGQITSAFVNLSGALGLIQEGKLRPLAVSTRKRSSVLPQVPAVAETLPGFEVNGWYGLMAPANTPPEIIKKLNHEVTEILKQPDVIARLKEGGMEPEPTTPEAYAAMIKAELPRWAAAVKAANIKE